MENIIFKTETNYLLAIAKNLKDILKEFRLQILESGLRIVEIDNANVCLLDISLNKGLCSQYEFKEGYRKDYCLNSTDFYNILKDNKKTSVSFYIENNKAVFKFDNGIKSELSFMEDERELRKEMPVMNFNTKIKLSSKRFKEIIKNFSNIGDNILIDLKQDILSLSTKNNINTSQIDLGKDEFSNALNSTDRAKYSLEYLSKFVKEQISEFVILKFSTDNPLIIEYKTPNLEINFLLAPRVEE